MGIHLLFVGHSRHGLDALAEASRTAPGIVDARLAEGRLAGALVLATCNRLEVLVDAEPAEAHALASALGGAPVLEGPAALAHLFRVASGLDSMVVGEREIAGQVRRAAEVAARSGALTPALSRAVQAASACSRRVAAATGLAGRGRSIVSVALDIAEDSLGPLEGRRAVLVGTGSYAGASVAALRDRGLRDIAVHSASGRAESFSRGHGTRPLPADGLSEALMSADLVVACRGTGSPALGSAELAAAAETRSAGRRDRSTPLLVLDLALLPDVDPSAVLPNGVVRIGLEDVAGRLPAVEREDVERAERIVAEALAAHLRSADGAGVDRAIVELRARIDAAVDEEIARLGPLADDESARTARALRRLGARLADAPCRRARLAVADGNAADYLDGLALVLGIGARP